MGRRHRIRWSLPRCRVPLSLTLKGLTYEPSGGIVAAATTSLPETLGGSRNWDYRYCWLRDSTFTLGALVGAGLLEEARAWQQWALRPSPATPPTRRSCTASTVLAACPNTNCPGYPATKAPRRCALATTPRARSRVTYRARCSVPRTWVEPRGSSLWRGWELQRWLAGRLQEAWKRPDNGIWESRGERQHFVYSKVMCWVATLWSTASSVSGSMVPWSAGGPCGTRSTPTSWRKATTPDGDLHPGLRLQALDACALLIPRVGFLPYDDERVISTVETIRNELTEDGLVLRYRTDQSDDGLTGREGSFLICSFWMVYALWGIGRHREAEELFDRLLALRNDVGLLSEEYDTRAQRLVGNFPQAFTHLALVNCALRLSDREVSNAARE